VQVDEPALREGLPLKRARWQSYLDWAVRAFRLSTVVAAPATQIVTHLCYSEFGDILPVRMQLPLPLSLRARLSAIRSRRRRGRGALKRASSLLAHCSGRCIATTRCIEAFLCWGSGCRPIFQVK
jgi:hypothetical protein